jgi:hypothetical protein
MTAYRSAKLSAQNVALHGALAYEAAALYGPLANHVLEERERRELARRGSSHPPRRPAGVRTIHEPTSTRYRREYDLARRRAEIRGVDKGDLLEARRHHVQAVGLLGTRPDLAALHQDMALTLLGAGR